MGYLAVLAASAGPRAGLVATAGVAVGLASAGIASSLGLAAIVATSSLVYEILRWGGAFYLLWLAWEGWRDASAGVGKAVDMRSHKEFFLKGFITNLPNPKAGIFYLSVFPAFIDDDRPLLAQTAILLAVYVTIATDGAFSDAHFPTVTELQGRATAGADASVNGSQSLGPRC